MVGYLVTDAPIRIKRGFRSPKRRIHRTGRLKGIIASAIVIMLWGVYSALAETPPMKAVVDDPYAASILSQSDAYNKDNSPLYLPDYTEIYTKRNMALQADFPSLDNPVVNCLEVCKREAKRFLIAFGNLS